MANGMDIETVERDGQVWVENLGPSLSRFVHAPTGLKYLFEPTGFAGSIMELPKRVTNDPYFRRAVARGRLRTLTPEEAETRMLELRIREDEAGGENSQIMDALAKGAAERMGTRYLKDDLQEFGVSQKEITAEEVWGRGKARITDAGPTTARPAADAGSMEDSGVAPSPTDIGGPLAPEQVLTERVRDGDPGWATTSDE